MGDVRSKYLEAIRIHKEYLLQKFEMNDFHGVQDAASDIRDFQSKLEAFGEIRALKDELVESSEIRQGKNV